jgi:limonene-1,2-epoxide hydrolase
MTIKILLKFKIPSNKIRISDKCLFTGNFFGKNFVVLFQKKMTVPQIANRLAELCNQGDFEKAQRELFAEDAISIEPYASTGFEKETKGLSAILEKGKKFNAMVEETHSCSVSNHILAGNAIALVLTMDVTMKGQERSKIAEICVYEVKDGKIISEQFFM